MAAIAILGVTLIILFELFSGSLKLARSSEDYLKATLLAQKKMNDLRLVNFYMEETEESGVFEEDPSYRWSVAVEPYSTEFKRDPKSSEIKKVELTVAWKADRQEKKFSVVRLYNPINWHYPGIDTKKIKKFEKETSQEKNGGGSPGASFSHKDTKKKDNRSGALSKQEGQQHISGGVSP